jgi:hypothetical protein
MQVTVGTTAVEVPIKVSATPVIQNLGPGVLYLDTDETVTTATGLKIDVGSAYEFPRDVDRSVFMVASVASTDVRIMVVG